MIETIRKEYPEMTLTRKRRTKNGEIIRVPRTIPGWYTCRYLDNGIEIAKYDSQLSALFLKTTVIGHDFSKSAYQRAMECGRKEAYKQLFEMLGVHEGTPIGEYQNA